jgi:hypothetical protein
MFTLPAHCCKNNLNNLFIIEYFLYRAPSTVVGFTCNQYDSKDFYIFISYLLSEQLKIIFILSLYPLDVKLIKKFSAAKLLSTIWKLEKFIQLTLFTNSIYYKFGIFIDLRCQLSQNIKLAFYEVKIQKIIV